MKTKTFSLVQACLLFFAGALIILITISFIYAELKASLFFEKSNNLNKPPYKIEQIDYYKHVLSLVGEALKYTPGNADYYAKKGDYLFGALEDGLGEELSIDKVQIEDAYKKAISLNPVNFRYHLKLGWFYETLDDSSRAEEELINASRLYPSYSQVYIYILKHYLKIKDTPEVFRYLLLALYYEKGCWRGVTEGIEKEILGLPGISWDSKIKELRFTSPCGSDEFSLKQAGFPHAKIPLKIKAFVKGNPEKVLLLKNSQPYLSLSMEEILPEGSIYGLDLSSFLSDAFLDSLSVKAKPYAEIQKVEAIWKSGCPW